MQHPWSCEQYHRAGFINCRGDEGSYMLEIEHVSFYEGLLYLLISPVDEKLVIKVRLLCQTLWKLMQVSVFYLVRNKLECGRGPYAPSRFLLIYKVLGLFLKQIQESIPEDVSASTSNFITFPPFATVECTLFRKFPSLILLDSRTIVAYLWLLKE